jgi:hypothetical protein
VHSRAAGMYSILSLSLSLSLSLPLSLSVCVCVCLQLTLLLLLSAFNNTVCLQQHYCLLSNNKGLVDFVSMMAGGNEDATALPRHLRNKQQYWDDRNAAGEGLVSSSLPSGRHTDGRPASAGAAGGRNRSGYVSLFSLCSFCLKN